MRLRIAIVAAAAVAAPVALAGAAPPAGCSAPGWPEPRQSSCGTAATADPDSPSLDQAPSLKLAWDVKLAAPAGNPIVDGSRVYVLSGKRYQRVNARSLDTGARLWSAISGGRNWSYPES